MSLPLGGSLGLDVRCALRYCDLAEQHGPGAIFGHAEQQSDNRRQPREARVGSADVRTQHLVRCCGAEAIVVPRVPS